MPIKLIFRKSNPHFHSLENVFSALLPYLKVETIELPFESKGLIYRLKNIRFLLKYKRNLIHISGHDHYLLWYPFKNAILTIHDIEALKRKRGIKKWLFKKLWFDWPIRNAQAITTISEFSKKEIQSLGNYKTPINVIPNPLTLPLTHSPKAFNQKKPRLLHIGTKANKNLERLIPAVAGLSVELQIIGALSPQQKKVLEKHGIDYVNASNLSTQEMLQAYHDCDVLLFVSTYEGFGLPIIEAQAVGRPVITSNLASMPEVGADACIYVDPYDVSAIQKAIEQLIEEAPLRTSLIQKGFENVKRFDAEEIARQYEVLYKDVLGT